MKQIWQIVFKIFIKNHKKKMGKEISEAMREVLKYSAKDYAEAIDFMKTKL